MASQSEHQLPWGYTGMSHPDLCGGENWLFIEKDNHRYDLRVYPLQEVSLAYRLAGHLSLGTTPKGLPLQGSSSFSSPTNTKWTISNHTSARENSNFRRSALSIGDALHCGHYLPIIHLAKLRYGFGVTWNAPCMTRVFASYGSPAYRSFSPEATLNGPSLASLDLFCAPTSTPGRMDTVLAKWRLDVMIKVRTCLERADIVLLVGKTTQNRKQKENNADLKIVVFGGGGGDAGLYCAWPAARAHCRYSEFYSGDISSAISAFLPPIPRTMGNRGKSGSDLSSIPEKHGDGGDGCSVFTCGPLLLTFITTSGITFKGTSDLLSHDVCENPSVTAVWYTNTNCQWQAGFILSSFEGRCLCAESAEILRL